MVANDRSRSKNKPSYTSRILFCLTLLLIMLHSLANSKTIDSNMLVYAFASEVAASETNTDYRRVYDEAGLLTPYEVEELEAISNSYGEEVGIEIFILTHNDRNATYAEKYIEDFEDQLPIGDRVYFLYDVYNGELFMEGYGLAEAYIHSKRIEVIFDNVEDYIRNGYYYDAFKTYISMSAEYMKDDSELNFDYDYSYDNIPEGYDDYDYGYDNIPEGYDDYDYSYDNIPEGYDDYDYSYDNIPEGYDDYDYSYDNTPKSSNNYDYNRYYRQDKLENSILMDFWFQLIVSLAIGAIVVGILAYRSSGRMTAGGRDYLDRSRGGLIGRRDQYIRSSVTRWRKPQQSMSSGGSRGGFNAGGFRGGSSSGGRSHSSGGRKL